MSVKDTIENPFRSVSHLCEALHLPQSRLGLGWRLVDATQGQIVALPQSRGRVVATDGVLCVIQTENNHLYFGHWEWFKADAVSASASTAKRPRKERVLPDFIV